MSFRIVATLSLTFKVVTLNTSIVPSVIHAASLIFGLLGSVIFGALISTLNRNEKMVYGLFALMGVVVLFVVNFGINLMFGEVLLSGGLENDRLKVITFDTAWGYSPVFFTILCLLYLFATDKISRKTTTE